MPVPEPGHLTPCVLAGGDGDLIPEFRVGHAAGQIFADPGVSQSLPGGRGLEKSRGDHAFRLLDPAGGEHLFRSPEDAFPQGGTVPDQKELPEYGFRVVKISMKDKTVTFERIKQE